MGELFQKSEGVTHTQTGTHIHSHSHRHCHTAIMVI